MTISREQFDKWWDSKGRLEISKLIKDNPRGYFIDYADAQEVSGLDRGLTDKDLGKIKEILLKNANSPHANQRAADANGGFEIPVQEIKTFDPKKYKSELKSAKEEEDTQAKRASLLFKQEQEDITRAQKKQVEAQNLMAALEAKKAEQPQLAPQIERAQQQIDAAILNDAPYAAQEILANLPPEARISKDVTALPAHMSEFPKAQQKEYQQMHKALNEGIPEAHHTSVKKFLAENKGYSPEAAMASHRARAAESGNPNIPTPQFPAQMSFPNTPQQIQEGRLINEDIRNNRSEALTQMAEQQNRLAGSRKPYSGNINAAIPDEYNEAQNVFQQELTKANQDRLNTHDYPQLKRQIEEDYTPETLRAMDTASRDISAKDVDAQIDQGRLDELKKYQIDQAMSDFERYQLPQLQAGFTGQGFYQSGRQAAADKARERFLQDVTKRTNAEMLGHRLKQEDVVRDSLHRSRGEQMKTAAAHQALPAQEMSRMLSGIQGLNQAQEHGYNRQVNPTLQMLGTAQQRAAQEQQNLNRLTLQGEAEANRPMEDASRIVNTITGQGQPSGPSFMQGLSGIPTQLHPAAAAASALSSAYGNTKAKGGLVKMAAGGPTHNAPQFSDDQLYAFNNPETDAMKQHQQDFAKVPTQDQGRYFRDLGAGMAANFGESPWKAYGMGLEKANAGQVDQQKHAHDQHFRAADIAEKINKSRASQKEVLQKYHFDHQKMLMEDTRKQQELGINRDVAKSQIGMNELHGKLYEAEAAKAGQPKSNITPEQIEKAREKLEAYKDTQRNIEIMKHLSDKDKIRTGFLQNYVTPSMEGVGGLQQAFFNKVSNQLASREARKLGNPKNLGAKLIEHIKTTVPNPTMSRRGLISALNQSAEENKMGIAHQIKILKAAGAYNPDVDDERIWGDSNLEDSMKRIIGFHDEYETTPKTRRIRAAAAAKREEKAAAKAKESSGIKLNAEEQALFEQIKGGGQ